MWCIFYLVICTLVYTNTFTSSAIESAVIACSIVQICTNNAHIALSRQCFCTSSSYEARNLHLPCIYRLLAFKHSPNRYSVLSKVNKKQNRKKKFEFNFISFQIFRNKKIHNQNSLFGMCDWNKLSVFSKIKGSIAALILFRPHYFRRQKRSIYRRQNPHIVIVCDIRWFFCSRQKLFGVKFFLSFLAATFAT